MDLEEAKAVVERSEEDLGKRVFVVAHTFERNGRRLHLAMTDRLRKACRKGRVWKSNDFLTAFKNGERGFDPLHAHSPGGADGVFVLTRTHRPKNEMMRKLFDRFLDKTESGAAEIARSRNESERRGARPSCVPSHATLGTSASSAERRHTCSGRL